MPLIKRYPNRKLYDTEAKRYVTLDELTRMIRAGQEVQVIDHESGEDLTNLTLTQIILEQEKRSATSVVPRALLTSLIRAGGDTFTQMRRSLGSAGPEGASDPEGSAAKGYTLPFSRLAGSEATLEEQAARAIEQGRQMVDQVQDLLRLDVRISELLHLFNVPTARDLQQLEARMEALSAKLEAIVGAHTKPPEPPDD